VKNYLLLILAILVIAVGCTSKVAKDTTRETAKDVVKNVNQGVDNLAQNVTEAAPLLQEDISQGFWNALDSVGDALGVDTGKELPKPGDEKIRQLHAQVDSAVAKSVVESAKKVKEQKVTDIQKALGILAQTIQEEINRSEVVTQVSPDGSVSSSSTSTVNGTAVPPGTSSTFTPGKLPTKKELKDAWEAFSKLTDRPAAVRKIFDALANFINSHPAYKAKAGIAGPVAKDKIGPKAQAFLDKLEPGDISQPFKFMKGRVIIQLIDNAADKIEVGYIYIPEEQPQTTPDGATATPAVSSSAGGQTKSGSAGGK